MFYARTPAGNGRVERATTHSTNRNTNCPNAHAHAEGTSMAASFKSRCRDTVRLAVPFSSGPHVVHQGHTGAVPPTAPHSSGAPHLRL